ncbi:UDP-glucosyltransferase 2-like [Schistocerca americana]|uniref:UDP-glucosyltransferase 2-like n=1 Tax=Schistocerca americana TaxID=7009 RepID=UPI001F4F969C|nr:UDP-glucosyltransferase 2-like [Schistocerca americana]
MQAILLLLLLLFTSCSMSARILGINPTASISHQKPFLIIMRALAERGHQVTAITSNPLKDPPQNLTQIDMSFTYPKAEDEEFRDLVTEITKTPTEKLPEVLLPYYEFACEAHFNFPEIKQLLRQDEKFDVVILEAAPTFCYFGFIHKLGPPPVIGFLSMGMTGGISALMGDTVNPSYMPEILAPYTDHMDFWQRMDNFLALFKQARSGASVILPVHERIIRKHFGPDVPSLMDMMRNMSLFLANNHFSANYPHPRLPNVIEMTGLHIEKERKPLPKEIQKFLDGADNGFIYFSLGSNMRSIFLSKEIRDAFLYAFSKLPQRILWKFEEVDLPGKPENVMVSKWLPQQDVLAHRNIRLFITQGGLQSFNEAAYFGVPLLGIPCFADQPYNIAKMVSAGIGEKMELGEINKESLLRVIRRLLDTPSYQENMQKFSAVFREHQATSLERAVWWVEYVIRHRGAPHLRSLSLDMMPWQTLLLDVAAVILLAAAVAAFLSYKVLTWLCCNVSKPRHTK